MQDFGPQARSGWPRAKNVWAHPVLCQGRLFLRYHDTLYCYDVRR